MQEFFMKMIINIFMSTISSKQIFEWYKSLKEGLKNKVASTETTLDDMFLLAILSQETQFMQIVDMIQIYLTEKTTGTSTNIDNIVWDAISKKLDEVQTLILADIKG